MIFQRLLLSMHMLVHLSEQSSLVFQTGELIAKNSTWRTLNRRGTTLPLIGYASYNGEAYFTDKETPDTILKTRNFLNYDEVLSVTAKTSQIVNTYDADLPLFLVTQHCLAWLAFYPDVEIQLWAGVRCEHYANGAVNHANFQRDRPRNDTLFGTVTLSRTHVYTLNEQTSVIISMGIDTDVNYEHSLLRIRYRLDSMVYIEDYVYFHQGGDHNILGRIMETYLNDPPSPFSSGLPFDTLFDKALLITPLSAPIVGSIDQVLLPNITHIANFKGEYLFIMGRMPYRASGAATAIDVSVIRVMSLTTFKVSTLCVENVTLEQYTRINDNYDDCATNIPPSTELYVLDFPPNRVNVIVHSNVINEDGEPRNFLQHNWQFEYGPNLTGVTTAPTTTTTKATTSVGTTNTQPTDPIFSTTLKSSTTEDNAANSRSPRSKVIYAALLSTFLLAADHGAFN